jgi:putative Holliday junction resolvase
MRILALDHGTKRIGVAVSDETDTLALPLEFINAEPFAGFLERLKTIINERNVGQVVVGIPRNMNGDYGPAAGKVRQFIAQLQPALAVAIKTWDERLTSVQANRLLIEAGMRRERRKIRADRSAAALLLQNYLDSVQHKKNET